MATPKRRKSHVHLLRGTTGWKEVFLGNPPPGPGSTFRQQKCIVKRVL